MLEPAEDNKLHEAVRLGDPDLVEGALSEGLDPNVVGMYQWCPLHEAASNGDLEVLQLLLKFKADPNKTDHLHSSTPLHYAAREGHDDCLGELIKAGGRYDAENSEGATPLNLAVDEECRDLLDRERTRQFLELSLADARKVIQRSTSKESLEDASFDSSPKFASSPFGRITPTAWETIEVIEAGHRSPGKTGTGLLQSSFEYNSKSGSLKVRVWQVEDILMPPAEFSAISRVYVKGHLLPDKKGETKRKTEEVKIDEPAKLESSIVTLRRESASEDFKSIYLPSTFKFATPLVYRDIHKEILSSRTVHLDVCVRMRYSTKSIPVASFQIPLRAAVRKLRKEKFRLLPCINYTAPDNVHSADPSEFVVTVEGLYANRTLSVPVLQKRTARIQPSREQARATSDINLKNVRCHSVESIPTVSLSISSEGDMNQEEMDNFGQLMEVKVHHARSTNQRSDEDSIILGNDDLTVVDIHRDDTPLPGSTEDVSMAIKVESGNNKLENHTKINLGKSVAETSFIGTPGYDQTENAPEIILPRILVTTPDEGRDCVKSVTIEMGHLMHRKKRGKTSGGAVGEKNASETRSRKKPSPNARPGHVVDMRNVQTGQSDAGDNLAQNSQKRAVSSSPQSLVFINKAFETDSLAENGEMEDIENLSGKMVEKSYEGRSRMKIGQTMAKRDVPMTPEVNYGLISEEMRNTYKRSPRSSPSSSPKPGLSTEQGLSQSISRNGSSSPLMSSGGSSTEGTQPNAAFSSEVSRAHGVSKSVLDLATKAVSEKKGMSKAKSKSRTMGEKANSERKKTPQDNFGFVAEETSKRSTSPRVGPTASPRRIASPGGTRNEGRIVAGKRLGETGIESDHADWGSRVNPGVNFGYISEELPREYRSPRSSPTASPKHLASSGGSQSKVVEGLKSGRQKSRGRNADNDRIGIGPTNPQVNFCFISEEFPRQSISPRSSPAASPKRESSSGSSSHSNMMGNTSPASKSLSSNGVDENFSNNSSFVVDMADERVTNGRGLTSQRGRHLNGDVSSSNIPPSPLTVQDIGGANHCKVRNHRSSVQGRFERHEVKRSINFDITPPLTKGIKTTDLVLPGENAGEPNIEKIE